jgi:hypothetical protein
MKTLFSLVAFCLLTLSGFAQQVKYSFEEWSYSPAEKGKGGCVYSTNIEDSEGRPKYTVTAFVDIQAKKISNVSIREYGQTKTIPLSSITHIKQLHLSTPNTGGVEAYACKGAGTNMVFYFLVGATTPDTLKFLFYLPAGPQAIQVGN